MNLSSVSGKNWIFKKFNSSDVIKYHEDFSITEIVAKLLSIRKKNIDNIDLFLNPKIKNLLPNPLHIKDMKKAIERTYKSISENEIMGIFGDYDVDGSCATTLLIRFLKNINHPFFYFIPDREKDGYGPSLKILSELINKKPKFIQIEFNWHQLFREQTIYKFSKILSNYEVFKILPFGNSLIKVDPKRPESNIFHLSNFVFIRKDISKIIF